MKILNDNSLNVTENKKIIYGLSQKDLNQVRKKHEKNLNYLKNHSFLTANGQVKTLLDVNMSANYSERYFPEVLNKIDTIETFLLSEYPHLNYVPIFLTITLHGFFRGFLYGDFSKYNPALHKKLIPNNERFGFLQDKIANNENFTIKDIYNCINFQWFRFNKSAFRKKLNFENVPFEFIKVAEPHKKDGVPHLHALVYCPADMVPLFKEFYKKYFPAPQNLKPLDKSKPNGDLMGFQTNIRSAKGYILKYVLKTFIDLKEKKEIDFLQAWYIKNRIPRIVTSRAIAPVWVYRKMMPLIKDWFDLTHIAKNHICEWSSDSNYISLTRGVTTYEYNNGVYTVYINNRISKRFGATKPTKSPNLISLKYKKKIKKFRIYMDGKEYIQKDNLLILRQYKKPISAYGDYELYLYYNKIKQQLDYINIKHFGVVQNELVSRGLIDGEIHSLNSFNMEFVCG